MISLLLAALAPFAVEAHPPLAVARFDAKTHLLRVVDNPGGASDLATAMQARGCIAGVNGGYFHPDWTPLGLVIADGRTLHRLERSALLTGLLVAAPGKFDVVRVKAYKAGWTQALQAGPFLVEFGRPVEGLEATREADRTAIATDGLGHGALVSSTPLTLAAFGELLAQPGAVPGLRVVRALNLDGGSSSAFWAKGSDLARPSLGAVRNFVAIAANPVVAKKPRPARKGKRPAGKVPG